MGDMSNVDVRTAMERGEIGVEPFEPGLLQAASLDLRLGRHFCEVTLKRGVYWLDVRKSIEEQVNVSIMDVDNWLLRPNEKILALSVERFTFSAAINGEVCCKSGIGRLFLTNTSDAGFYDPGFRGKAVLEIKNQSDMPILLYAGMKIGQMRFSRLDTPSDQPYHGHFQDQGDFAIGGWFRSLGRLMEHAEAAHDAG